MQKIFFLFYGKQLPLAPFYELMSKTVYDEFTDSFAFNIGGESKPWLLKKNNVHLLENELELKSGTIISEHFHKIVRVFDHLLFLEDLLEITLNFKKCSPPHSANFNS